MDLLTWAIIAFVISLVAGALGYTNVARGAKKIAKILFIIFLVLALVLLLFVVIGVGVAT